MNNVYTLPKIESKSITQICRTEYIVLKEKHADNFESIDTNEFSQLMLVRHGIKPTTAGVRLREFKASDRRLVELIKSNLKLA